MKPNFPADWTTPPDQITNHARAHRRRWRQTYGSNNGFAEWFTAELANGLRTLLTTEPAKEPRT